MLNHPRSAKKNRGRSLIRDRDRTATPMNSPRPEKEDSEAEKKEEEKEKEVLEKKKEESDSSDDERSEPTSSQGRPKRAEKKTEKAAAKGKIGEKVEEAVKKEEEDKVSENMQHCIVKSRLLSLQGQQTRSKSSLGAKTKDLISSPDPKRDLKTPTSDSSSKSSKTSEKKTEEKKRGRKRINPEDKSSLSDSSATDSSVSPHAVNLGDKLKVYYGPTHESKVTYEAKVLEIERDATGPIYLVHYTGWNTRYDEWIQSQRIAENLSATTKAKRLKQGAASTSKVTLIILLVFKLCFCLTHLINVFRTSDKN